MKSSKKNVRLSKDVLPVRYQVMVKPDFETYTFTGEVKIDLKLKKSTRYITLHAKELELFGAEAHFGKESAEARAIKMDKKSETAIFSFAKPLPKGKVRIHIIYKGELNDKMRGFYRSSFEHKGKKHHIAITQFESTDARCALPCVDEPAAKAIFDVTLVVPKDMQAISNTLPVDTTQEGALKSVRFAPTPLMSTYLLAFIVGNFECIQRKSADGVLVRVFTTPGKKQQAKFALDTAAKTITFFNKYFAIPYPLPVLDMIAIPDFAAGAMENWGAITYRESALLVDVKNSSSMNKQWVALVIAHEIAHQWFGNLVTMEWWTHLWLNEGFASYIEYLAVDKLFPSWDMWTQFLVADMRPALHLDALLHTHPIEVEVHHPSEIAAVFDAVSYSKGASVIRMLAEYVGEKHFRDGLRYYLKKHRYGNTETMDLWRALGKVSKKPVAKMMAAWTGKGGYPLVSVSEDATHLSLEQSRFFSSPLSEKKNKERSIWHVPVSIATEKGVSKEVFLLDVKRARIKKPKAQWLKMNAEESAFYRTTYAPEMRENLAHAAKTKALKTRDRLGLVRDVFAVSDAGKMLASEALAFASEYASETEYVVWAEIASSMATIHGLLAHEPFLQDYEDEALALYMQIGAQYPWDTKPKDHVQALQKTLVLGSLGRYGDTGVRDQAFKHFKSITAEKNAVPADLRGVVYGTVARFGGPADYRKLTALYKAVPLHEEKNRIGAALGGFRDAALLAQTLDFSLSDEVRLQDKTRMIAGVSVNPSGTDLSWKFIQKHWKTFTERFAGGRELAHLIEPLRVSTNVAHAGEIEKFFKKHPTPGTERTVRQVAEQIRANAAWLARNKASLASYLAS